MGSLALRSLCCLLWLRVALVVAVLLQAGFRVNQEKGGVPTTRFPALSKKEGLKLWLFGRVESTTRLPGPGAVQLQKKKKKTARGALAVIRPGRWRLEVNQ